MTEYFNHRPNTGKISFIVPPPTRAISVVRRYKADISIPATQPTAVPHTRQWRKYGKEGRRTDAETRARERERVKIMTACSSLRFPNEKGREGVRNITPFTKSGPCTIIIMYCLAWVRRADRAMRFHADYFNMAVSSTEALLPEVLTTTLG